MIDFSKTKENVCYNDCKKCIHDFGKNKNCFNCNYYTDCMAEKEIDKFLEAVEKEICRCETDFEGEMFRMD